MGMLCSCVCPKESNIEDFNTKDPQKIQDSSKVDRDHFIFLKLLGTGQHGKVYLVKKINTGELFAMKVLCKKDIDYKKQRYYTISEKNILMKLNSHFIVKLKYSFQDIKNLYIVMEFVEGGELFSQIKKQGRVNEENIKFYIAELILAIEYLHRNGIIYRDLKPENVLIGEDGHIKLTDFGNSKADIDDVNSTAYTICGTVRYLAPEILRNQGYNKAVDYWSLGVLSYEMITGISPFDSENKEDIYKKILNKELVLKGNLSFMASDVIDKLLTIDAEERLNYCLEIKNHNFFEGLEWGKLERKELKAPFMPTSNKFFDTKLSTSKILSDELDAELISELNSSSFVYQNFTYCHDEKL